ncbi:MAG: small multi-drug export protein [Treponema sp.]|nr:small multi-drug export protein [Treponema sp.]
MSTAVCLFWTAILSFTPISELRGAIPFAVANGIPWYLAFFLAVICNILVAPVCWIFLATVHKLLYGTEPEKGIQWYKNIFDKFIEKARKKVSAGFEKWGWLGIAGFVGIPFPLTGAWTGTLGAWVLGVSRRRTMLAVILGVIVSGAIVTAVTLGAVKGFNIFLNNKWR